MDYLKTANSTDIHTAVMGGVVKIGKGCKIASTVRFDGSTGDPIIIGNNVVIEDYSYIGKGTVIGSDTRILSHTRIENDCELGDKCFVGSHVILRPETKLAEKCRTGHNVVSEGWCSFGKDCMIHDFSQITKGAVVGEKVFVGPGVHFTNDAVIAHCRREVESCKDWYNPPTIKRGAMIGTMSILVAIKGGLVIGENCQIAAGAVVTKSVPDYAIVMGVPAKVVGEVPEEKWV